LVPGQVIGEWQRTERPFDPYNGFDCNGAKSGLSFHSWKEYPSDPDKLREKEVRMWAWAPQVNGTHPNSMFLQAAFSFLKVFGKKRIIFSVGDSHAEDQTQSLLCILAGATGGKLKMLNKAPIIIRYHPDYKPVIFMRWDQINRVQGKDADQPKLLKAAMRFGPSLVLVNSGAHFSTPKCGTHAAALQAFEELVPKFVSSMCKHRSVQTVVWRATSNHFFGDELGVSQRGKRCIAADRLVANPELSGVHDTNHIQRMNEVMKAHGQHTCPPGKFVYLDIANMQKQRPDATCRTRGAGNVRGGENAADCAHMCLPGVPDWYNLKMLQDMASREWDLEA